MENCVARLIVLANVANGSGNEKSKRPLTDAMIWNVPHNCAHDDKESTAA